MGLSRVAPHEAELTAEVQAQEISKYGRALGYADAQLGPAFEPD